MTNDLFSFAVAFHRRIFSCLHSRSAEMHKIEHTHTPHWLTTCMTRPNTLGMSIENIASHLHLQARILARQTRQRLRLCTIAPLVRFFIFFLNSSLVAFCSAVLCHRGEFRFRIAAADAELYAYALFAIHTRFAKICSAAYRRMPIEFHEKSWVHSPSIRGWWSMLAHASVQAEQWQNKLPFVCVFALCLLVVLFLLGPFELATVWR